MAFVVKTKHLAVSLRLTAYMKRDLFFFVFKCIVSAEG